MKFAVVYSEEAEAAMDAEIGAAIKELGADTLLRRDELHKSKLDVDIIVVIGGDGTLFYSTHYLQEGHIIGLHIGNRRSIGHFFKAREVAQVKDILARIEAGDNSGFKQFPRLKASIVTGTGREYSIEKAFNDYAVGNSKFGLPSKYFISTGEYDESGDSSNLQDQDLEDGEAEFQRSSGVVIPTLQGMTGWAKNIIPDRFDQFLEEYQSHGETGLFPFFVREAMMDYVNINGFTKKLLITSDMHHGVVAVDGFRDFPVERGDKIIIEMSSYPIWMYVGSD